MSKNTNNNLGEFPLNLVNFQLNQLDMRPILHLKLILFVAYNGRLEKSIFNA